MYNKYIWNAHPSEEQMSLQGKGFFISYNKCPKDPFFGERGEEETALVSDPGAFEDRSFRILKGDHRKDYEEIYKKGLQACLNYYESSEAKSEHSTPKSLKEILGNMKDENDSNESII